MGIIALPSLRISAVGDNVYPNSWGKSHTQPFQKGWTDIPLLKNKQL